METITNDKKTPEIVAQALGVSLADAEFILAIELGEIDGDVIGPDDAPPPPQLFGGDNA